MWKWIVAWFALVTVLVVLVASLGLYPKPITKISLSQFPSQDLLAQAVRKRLFFELKNADNIVISHLNEKAWMSEFYTSFTESKVDKPVDYKTFSDRAQRKTPEQNTVELLLVDFDSIPTPPSQCTGLKGEKQVYCLSNGMRWRLKRKAKSLKSGLITAQLEQLGKDRYALYVTKTE